MKKALLILGLITSNAFGENIENCSTSLPFPDQAIMEFAETKCLSEDFTKDDIIVKLAKDITTQKFCKGCKNHLLKLKIEEEGLKFRDKKNESYSVATLKELQKEMTFISTDLMKMRSSFSLTIDTANSIKKCDFQKMKKPSCSRPSDIDFLDKEIGKIQNTMATELANILSPNPLLNEGLFSRSTPNLCGIKDNEAMFAQMRYNESLLTKELIDSLKKLNIRTGSSISGSIQELKDKEGETSSAGFSLLETTKRLSNHPLMKPMFNDPEKLKAFLAQISKDDSNEVIIEKLYHSEIANDFGNEISRRCETAFKSTSDVLEKVYCSNNQQPLATNAKTMSLLDGKSFKDLSDHEAEASIQKHCTLINMASENKTLKPKGFDDIFEINVKNDSLISQLPIENFKSEAYKSIIGTNSAAICSAMKDKSICKKDPKSEQCQTLSYLEESRQNKQFKRLANSSDENINSILRSLVGNGLPEKDGKVDQVAIRLLKDQGILPGGDITPKDPGARDAGTFFKTVSNETNGTTPSPIPQSQTKTTQAPTPQFSPTSNTTAAVNEPEKDDSSDSSKTTAPTTSAGTKQATNKFSNLSDSEQQDLLDRLKPKAKNKGAKTQGMNSASNQSDDSSIANGPTNSLNPSTRINQDDSVSNTAAQAPSVQNKFPASSGTQAKLDSKVVRKDASLNEAKLSALQNRGPASDPVKDTTIALSKTESGLNKIEIKVPDESILDKKTPDLEAKIQDYLDKSASSLTGAKKGEAFIVKLGKYDIKVAINDYGVYVASCKDTSLHPEYLAFLSRYFTGYKERVSTRLSMENIISKEQKKAN